jgi:hypothetical protein
MSADAAPATSDRPDEGPVRGASDELLAQPAGEVLGNVPWDGIAPDPDATDAATFLSWL